MVRRDCIQAMVDYAISAETILMITISSFLQSASLVSETCSVATKSAPMFSDDETGFSWLKIEGASGGGTGKFPKGFSQLIY